MKEIKKDKENISFEIPIGNIHEILFVTSRQKLFFFFLHPSFNPWIKRHDSKIHS